MKLLAIETSTIACSAALYDGSLSLERFEIAPREHAELLLPMIDALLAEAGWSREGLDVVAFGRGPGAFTGLRIAAAVAQGIAFGLDLPVVPVSTLAALARGAMQERKGARVIAAMDARMGEVYWGVYDHPDGSGEQDDADTLRLHGEEQVCAPAEAALPEGAGWFGAGDGWGAYGETLRPRLGPRLAGWDAGLYPHARDVARLAVPIYRSDGAVPPEQALPVYLRDKVAQPKRKNPPLD